VIRQRDVSFCNSDAPSLAHQTRNMKQITFSNYW
jgi:hypothetical protein